MKRTENNSIEKNAEMIKASIIAGSIGLVLLFKSGVDIGAMLLQLIH